MARVLIATMDSRQYDALSAEVSGEGHDVIWALDGKDAYDQTLAQAPELVFLDESLEVFNAFEVAEMFRGDPDVPAALPVFLLSDHAVEPHRFEHSGFTGQFTKTHGYHELRELLAAHIRPETTAW